MTKPATDIYTAAELEAIRAELTAEAAQLRADLADSEQEVEGIVNDSGSAVGDDYADTGNKAQEREQEMFVAGQVGESIRQIEHALARIEAGTYGLCEECGQAIGKERLAAFPRATLCMACKIAEGG
jgi:RNA polymerase-binding protein DksA